MAAIFAEQSFRGEQLQANDHRKDKRADLAFRVLELSQSTPQRYSEARRILEIV